LTSALTRKLPNIWEEYKGTTACRVAMAGREETVRGAWQFLIFTLKGLFLLLEWLLKEYWIS
jgi:hypothetical protein